MHLPTDSIPPELKADALETRGTQWGDISVRYLDLPPGVDFTPLFKGLPGDLCQSPHWGYVLRARSTFDMPTGTRAHPGRRGLLLARRAHRLDPGGRHLPRVQPGRRHQARPGTPSGTDDRMRPDRGACPC